MIIFNGKEVAVIEGKMSLSSISNGLAGILWGIALFWVHLLELYA